MSELVRAAVAASVDGRRLTLAEARDKLAAGMKVLIREGSAARNFAALAPLLRTHPDRTIAMFIQAYTFGRVLSSFDSKRAVKDNEEWVALVDDVIDRLLFS